MPDQTNQVVSIDTENRNVAHLLSETRRRWVTHRQFDTVPSKSLPPPWDHSWTSVPYGHFMRAQVLYGVSGEMGILNVSFQPDQLEDDYLHTHPGGRIITITAGSGHFVFRDDTQQHAQLDLAPGIRIWMPPRVVHTFASGPDGLWIRSLHLPFVPLDNKDAITAAPSEDVPLKRLLPCGQ